MSGLPAASPGYGCPGVTSLSAATRISLPGVPSHVFLQDVGAMQAAHVLPAHLGRLPDLLQRLGGPHRRRAGALDDLVAALAVDLAGLDVHGEELHLAVVEAVVGLERRQVPAI